MITSPVITRFVGSVAPIWARPVCRTAIIRTPTHLYPALLPGAQRDELRRDPVHPDAQGPLDPLKHQIDIADLQDTRDLFAFDRLVLDPDGDARVTRHLLYFDRIVLLESGMLRELDKEQWLDELN